MTPAPERIDTRELPETPEPRRDPMKTPTLRALSLAVALAAACLPALAQECADLTASPPDADVASATLANLAADGCLGSAGKPCLAELDALCREVDDFEQLSVDPADPTTEIALARAFVALPEPLRAALPAGKREEDALRAEMRQQFVTYLQNGKADVARARYQPNGHVFFAHGASEVDLDALLEDACATDCAEGLHRAARFYTVAALYRRSLGKLLEGERLASLTYLDGLDKRWQAYFSSAYSQYPWELALNSSRYKRSPALAEPPTRQFILAHPGVAYEIIKEDGEQTLKESLILELVGFHRWQFDGDKLRRPFGASLLVSWHGSTGDEVGYGVILHLPRSWSLGVTYRQDSDFAALVSADLGKLITNGRGLYERVFEH